jgi:hypothetical protein
MIWNYLARIFLHQSIYRAYFHGDHAQGSPKFLRKRNTFNCPLMSTPQESWNQGEIHSRGMGCTSKSCGHHPGLSRLICRGFEVVDPSSLGALLLNELVPRFACILMIKFRKCSPPYFSHWCQDFSMFSELAVNQRQSKLPSKFLFILFFCRWAPWRCERNPWMSRGCFVNMLRKLSLLLLSGICTTSKSRWPSPSQGTGYFENIFGRNFLQSSLNYEHVCHSYTFSFNWRFSWSVLTYFRNAAVVDAVIRRVLHSRATGGSSPDLTPQDLFYRQVRTHCEPIDIWRKYHSFQFLLLYLCIVDDIVIFRCHILMSFSGVW